MIWVVLSAAFSVALAMPPSHNILVGSDGSYRFSYDTGEEGGHHSRSEVRHPDGRVEGTYAYEDADGARRRVTYRADRSGFVQESAGAADSSAEDPKLKLEENEESSQPRMNEEEPLGFLDSSADEPPEGFPQGYFLQQHQWFRRLPDPTKEEEATPTATEATTPENTSTPLTPTEAPVAGKTDRHGKGEDTSVHAFKDKLNQVEPFFNQHPFRYLSPRQWATSLLHQPMRHFSFQHPEFRGFSYYF